MSITDLAEKMKIMCGLVILSFNIIFFKKITRTYVQKFISRDEVELQSGIMADYVVSGNHFNLYIFLQW